MGLLPHSFRPRAGSRVPVTRLSFIVVGAQKCGTTALNYYLKRHRRIALPLQKELHFFDDDELFVRGDVNYRLLHGRFSRVRPDSIAGENTPNYLYWPPVMQRIFEYNPLAKLIILLRNPIERAFSQWNMQRVRQIEPLDFIDAIRAEPERLNSLPPPRSRKFAYVDRGRYAGQIARVFALFPKEQVLVLKYETFRERQQHVVDKVFRFLELEPPRFRPVEAHNIPHGRKLRPDERASAFELLKNDIFCLEEILGWDCSDWC
ncbi:MAG: sulfotransferase [Verrucomicrobia bacterium]|nr:sulfotransferase [Verrucomicrobiota bacterium]